MAPPLPTYTDKNRTYSCLLRAPCTLESVAPRAGSFEDYRDELVEELEEREQAEAEALAAKLQERERAARDRLEAAKRALADRQARGAAEGEQN